MLRWWLELGSAAGAPDIPTKIAMIKPALTSAGQAKHFSSQHVTEGVNDVTLGYHCMRSSFKVLDDKFNANW